jgi:hypothetical protein
MPAGPTDARHSRGPSSRSHHGHRAATVPPQSLQRLVFTEKEDLPSWAAQSAEDDTRVSPSEPQDYHKMAGFRSFAGQFYKDYM